MIMLMTTLVLAPTRRKTGKFPRTMPVILPSATPTDNPIDIAIAVDALGLVRGDVSIFAILFRANIVVRIIQKSAMHTAIILIRAYTIISSCK